MNPPVDVPEMLPMYQGCLQRSPALLNYTIETAWYLHKGKNHFPMFSPFFTLGQCCDRNVSVQYLLVAPRSRIIPPEINSQARNYLLYVHTYLVCKYLADLSSWAVACVGMLEYCTVNSEVHKSDQPPHRYFTIAREG